MKKKAIGFGVIFLSFLFFSQGLLAQRYLRRDAGIQAESGALDLTPEQIEEIENLERELEKELFPLLTNLISLYLELEEIEAERNPDLTKMEKTWESIRKIEFEIRTMEITYEQKMRVLLSPEQHAALESFYVSCLPYYGRGGFGRGYGGRRFGYGAGRMARSYYGNGNRYGIGMGYYSRGTGRLGLNYDRSLTGVRYGRGPCGLRLGRWYRMGFGRGRWYW